VTVPDDPGPDDTVPDDPGPDDTAPDDPGPDDTVPDDPGPDGIVRVGVTGHRELADPDAVRRAVDDAVRALDDEGRRPLEVWSSLADGADRVVARAVLARPRSRLVAVLPLEVDDYRADFDAAGAAELDELVGIAHAVHVTGPDAGGTRESAYDRAGRMVVDGCDVLIAIWDGGPSGGRGGTADIVDAARAADRRTVVITADRR
jgi:hypothetical protein